MARCYGHLSIQKTGSTRVYTHYQVKNYTRYEVLERNRFLSLYYRCLDCFLRRRYVPVNAFVLCTLLAKERERERERERG